MKTAANSLCNERISQDTIQKEARDGITQTLGRYTEKMRGIIAFRDTFRGPGGGEYRGVVWWDMALG